MNKIMTLCLALLASGCETISNITVSENVQAWQKAALAEPAMQFPQDGMQGFADEHIYFSKEASSGGNGVGGGGCGCN